MSSLPSLNTKGSLLGTPIDPEVAPSCAIPEHLHHSLQLHSSAWLVTIDIGSKVDPIPVILQDPFDQEQQNECRWYVEYFACKSPYSVTRARNSANELQRYVRSLQNQLGFAERLRHVLSTNTCRNIAVSICEDGASRHSIHQIHWELLEDSSSWDIDVDVTVTRMIISDGGNKRDTVHNAKFQEERAGTTPFVNGLLVVARDLSKDSNRHDDVSPCLALEVLSKIQEDLQSHGDQSLLRFRVVRPGSLEALQQHLKRAADIHGKGFYNFVHFDLHGAIQSTAATSYLLFNDPNPEIDNTRRESAQLVAKLLVEHGVQIAVLNACESARATSGNDLNIAKIFTNSGLRIVVAMSFKVCSSAAELFLRAFYHYLFFDGNTYSQAASRARSQLRRYPMRAARLGLQRSLVDYFVPVVYSDGSDLIFSQATPQKIGKPFDAARFAPNSSHSLTSRDDCPIGREFDLLRLERKLISQTKVHLTGQAGVGKTALVKHLSFIWRKTSFVDLALYVDFSKIYDIDQAVRTFTSQIPMSVLQRMGLRAELRNSINAPKFDSALFDTHILNACAKRRILIILDGLQAFYPKESYFMPNRPSEKSVPQLSRFIEALVNLGTGPRQTYDIFHVLVSRWDAETLPLTEKLKQAFMSHHFRLPSLRLSDSVQIAQLALCEAGLSVDEWNSEKMNELELLLGYLDGNPSAILQIVPQMPRIGVTVREFRVLVQDGNVQKRLDGPGKDISDEIDKLFSSVNDEARAILLLLSSFWLEGMGIGALLDWAISSKFCKERASALVLSYARSRGLLDIESGASEQEGGKPDLVMSWIHPLLTIYGRKTVYETLAAIQREGLSPIPLFSSVRNTFSYFLPSLRHPGESQRAVAAQIISIIRAPSSESLLSQDLSTGDEKFLFLFLREVPKCDLYRLAITMVKGFSYEELYSFWVSQSGNLRTCLSICAREPYLAVDYWPLEYFEYHIANIRIVGSPVQLADFAGLFEKLFDVFIDLNGSLAVPPEYQVFALLTATCLTAIYSSDVPIPDRHKKYVQMALNIVAESEGRFGPLEEAKAIYLKGLAMRYQVMHLLLSGNHGHAVNLWSQMLEVDRSIFEGNAAALGTQWSLEQIEDFTTSISGSDTNSEEIRRRLKGISSNTMLEAFYKSRKYSSRFIRAAANTVANGGDPTDSRQYRSILAQLGDGLEQIYKGADTMGFKGINQDPRWWPQDFNMNHFKLDNPEARLTALENAASSGDNRQATLHLSSLLAEACKNLDMDDIEEYVDALAKHSDQSYLPSADSVDWESKRVEFSLYKTAMNAFIGNSANRKSIVANALAKQIQLLKEQGASRQSIESLEISLDIWQKQPQSLRKIDENEEKQMTERNRAIAQLIVGKLKKDRNFAKVLPAINLQYQQLVQQLQDAELKENWDLALERLEAIESFCRLPENDFLAVHSGPDWYRSSRINYLFTRDSKTFVEEFSNALMERDYQRAQCLVQTFEAELNPELRDRATEPLAKWKASIEFTPLEFAVQDMHELRRSGRTAEAIQAANNIIERVENGRFEFPDAEKLRKYSYSARLEQTELYCLNALLSDSFGEAALLINALRQLLASNPDLSPPDNQEKLQELEDMMAFKLHFAGLVVASQSWNLDEYERHTKGFRALYEQQKRTVRSSSVKPTFNFTVDRWSLLQMETWLVVF